ncbi:TPA: DUF452 family protein [Candidatus Galligastranaerophilus faecipullorum]|nr:DUF452 family protein [Candidatus Galligastranaerophilus faecipullorum]
MKTEFISHNKSSLIVFFCGFYTDANCFIEFDNGKNDLLFVYDYSDMENNPLEYFDFLDYTKVSVIAYSYGVWALNYVYNQNLLPKIESSCALCGTFCPIDNEYGVNEKIYDLMARSLNSDTIEKFEQKMALGATSPLKIKSANRKIENLSDELLNIKVVSKRTWFKKNFEFDKVVLARKDRIFPYSSQANFWAAHKHKVELECGHFPFFEFKDFDEILES